MPEYPYLYNIGIILSQRELEKQLIDNLPELDLKLTNIKKLYPNNPTLYLKSSLGDMFTFLLNKNKITIWNYTGGIQIINNLKIPHNGWSVEFTVKYLFEQLDNFTNDFVMCKKCNKIVHYSEVKNNVDIEGIYCDKCWLDKGSNKKKEYRKNSCD